MAWARTWLDARPDEKRLEVLCATKVLPDGKLVQTDDKRRRRRADETRFFNYWECAQSFSTAISYFVRPLYDYFYWFICSLRLMAHKSTRTLVENFHVVDV